MLYPYRSACLPASGGSLSKPVLSLSKPVLSRAEGAFAPFGLSLSKAFVTRRFPDYTCDNAQPAATKHFDKLSANGRRLASFAPTACRALTRRC